MGVGPQLTGILKRRNLQISHLGGGKRSRISTVPQASCHLSEHVSVRPERERKFREVIYEFGLSQRILRKTEKLQQHVNPYTNYVCATPRKLFRSF